MNRIYKKMMWGVLLLIIGALLLYYFGLARYFGLENIKNKAVYLKSKVESNYTGAVFFFIALFTALIGFTLPVTGPMGIMAGFLFGFIPGVIYSMIAGFIGTTISYIVVRRAMTHIMRQKHQDRLDAFNDRIGQYGYSYLISLQLLTVVPYFVINTLAALAGVPLWAFMWTTFVGSLPVVAIYTYAGKELYMIQNWKDILGIHTLIILLLLAALSLLPMLVKKLRKTEL